MKRGIVKILEYLTLNNGFDYVSYRPEMLERRLLSRMTQTNTTSTHDYFQYLINNKHEQKMLVSSFLINVSEFFRDPLSFGILAQTILPSILNSKIKERSNSIRIWSAGCANGEEPYSVAMLIDQLVQKTNIEMNIEIFATDLDKVALENAKLGVYNKNSLLNTNLAYIESYFEEEANRYKIKRNIKQYVRFSEYDLLHQNSSAPSESIYGGFDLILCRNLLIYLQKKSQQFIFQKFYKTLNNEGYLMLGESELPIGKHKVNFRQITDLSKIYQKQ